MNTIDDFVNRRWHDAKYTLRRLDSRFVDKVEYTVRLQSVGLSTPRSPNSEDTPRQRLSKRWHQLLEACLELTIEASRLQVSTQSLGTDAYLGMLPVDVGQRVDYHLSSWVTHAVTLSDRVKEVITRTVETYMGDGETAKTLSKRYREHVEQEITKSGERPNLRSLRKEFVHGNQRSWQAPLLRKTSGNLASRAV